MPILPILTVGYTEPSVFVATSPTVNGDVITAGFKLVVLPIGTTPPADDSDWADPVTNDDQTVGISVGADTDFPFTQGSRTLVWVMYQDDPDDRIWALVEIDFL